ncbi:SDR family NAD(P)-dependent oxidoreductase [Prauserella flavalba]|uniref:SDR family oxidoreductase n=1 Tax=Prauserella flavalba TaxID=1477506 RepID=A0A318LFP7_9PSEU|nr:SDR family oxidoreductase [Prauserella flavalba]PXY17947.1 hypothetical protein BA062_36420 [Prauserella flavalba]
MTGGGRHLGRAIALRLAESGWDCLVAGPDETELTVTAKSTSASAGTIAVCPRDVASPDGRHTLTSLAAGIAESIGLFVNVDPQEDPRTVSALSRWAIQRMSGAGGSVVNVGRGLAALTRELAVAAARWNVRVNTVAPGMIKTPEHDVSPEMAQLLCDATPLRRLGTPDDVAAVVEFLASDGAAFVTGAEWVVDGGWSVW